MQGESPIASQHAAAYKGGSSWSASGSRAAAVASMRRTRLSDRHRFGQGWVLAAAVVT